MEWNTGLLFFIHSCFSVVPDEALELANPVVLLSGFSPLEVCISLTIYIFLFLTEIFLLIWAGLSSCACNSSVWNSWWYQGCATDVCSCRLICSLLFLLDARNLLLGVVFSSVPKAMSKRMDQVLEELNADHALNAPPA